MAGALGAIVLTVIYFVVLPPFAWLAKRAERREAGRLAPDSHGGTRDRRRASIDMKILGISAHYHDSAAALVVDGVPVCAVQEERLSRHKNDAGFPVSAIEWCLDRARARSGRPRRRGLLRAQHAEVRSDPHLRAAGASRARGDPFRRPIKNSLGEKVWVRGIISSHLGVPRQKILFTGHHASHAAAALLHRADAARSAS